MQITLAKGQRDNLSWSILVDAKECNSGRSWCATTLSIEAGIEEGRLSAVAKASISPPLEIPADFVDSKTGSLKTVAISDAAKDFIRRYGLIEISWDAAEQGFFGVKEPLRGDVSAELSGVKQPLQGDVSAELSGTVRLNWAELLIAKDPKGVADDPKSFVAEVAMRGSIKATIDMRGANKAPIPVEGGLTASMAIAVVFRANEVPRLRIDLDDLNISLPECEFPKLKFAADPQFLSFKGAGLARALEKLAGGLTVTVDAKNAGVRLVLDEGQLEWSVVQQGTTNPQPIAVEVGKDNRLLFSVKELTVQYEGSSTDRHLKITGTIDANTEIKVPDGGRKLGPLRLDWKGLRLQLSASTTLRKFQPAIVLKANFERIILSAVGDPEAVIALNGEVWLTPSGLRIERLALVDPFPMRLIFGALEKTAQRAQDVLRVLASLNPGADLARLMNALGRIAAAAARAVLFVEDQLGQALVAIARAVGGVFENLGKWIKAAGAVDIEIRMTLDPLELRQVILTERGSTTLEAASAGGFKLEIFSSWRPAVLFDFVTQPGVYLLAVREGTENDVAQLSTDLWLTNPASQVTSPMRDADPKTGERATEPLLSLGITSKLGTPRQAIVLVGISRGEPVFLQKLKTAPKPVTITTDTGEQKVVVVYGDDFSFEALTKEDVSIEPTIRANRVLSLLGMGETGGGKNFLEDLKKTLGQVVWVDELSSTYANRTVTLHLKLGIKVAGITAYPTVKLDLSLDDFRVKVKAGDKIILNGKKAEQQALGLQWIVNPRPPLDHDQGPLFQLNFKESTFSLAEGAKMEISYAELSSDGAGLIFDVTEFSVGRDGVTIVAAVRDQPVRLNGLDVPFRFTTGRIVIRKSQLVEAAVAGSGKLPRELAGDAGASIALVFAQQDGAITLQSASARIDKAGEPIQAHLTRFTLTITQLGLDMVRDNGIHFYFLVTGTLQFTPKPGEFDSGLLKFLKDVRITLDKAPLAGDARVLARHISFQVALNPKQRFNLFNVFSFELRGIGFHPASPKFDGNPPAMNISGQIEFADIGDVMQPKIDFHDLWIAPPKAGDALPRIRLDGLGVEIGLAGTAKLTGTVRAVDETMPTLEGDRFPTEYKAHGFLGEGRLEMSGFATLAASFGFLEVQDKSELKRAFFLFLQQEQVAYEIPTPIWPLYLREVGFGFGYRYTLAGIKDAEHATSTAELIRILDDVSTRQNDLARFSAWKPDPEKENVTLALRGAVQVAPAQKKWGGEAAEGKVENPFFFDLTAALRSDMTFLMSVRGWLSVNYWNFLNNADNLRTNPMFRGYLYISAPRSELLARFLADPKGYIGKTPRLAPTTELALRSIQWSATLYIRPGLFQFELGWPDQLKVQLFNEPDFKVEVRGGFIFRVWDHAFLYAYNVEANAFLRIGGQAGGGSLGLSAYAELSAAFVARFIASVDFQGGGVLLYGLVSIDARLALQVHAWLHIDLVLTSINIDINFTLELQLTAAVEMAIADNSLGARGRATVSISVFGARLPVTIGFSINPGRLDEARARVDRFLNMSLTAGAPEPPKEAAAKAGDKAIQANAAHAEPVAAQAQLTPADAPKPPTTAALKAGDAATAKTAKVAEPQAAQAETKQVVPGRQIGNAGLGQPIAKTDFWLVLRRAGGIAPGLEDVPDLVYATLVPRDDQFYAGGNKQEEAVYHKLRHPKAERYFYRLDANGSSFARQSFIQPSEDSILCTAEVHTLIPSNSKSSVTLRTVLNECFLYDGTLSEEGRVHIDRFAEPKRRQAPPANQPVEDAVNHVPENPDVLRDRRQRDFQALQAEEGRAIEAVRGARSTLLLKFLDDFVVLCDSGTIPDRTRSVEKRKTHFADFGLVFGLSERDVDFFVDQLQVVKSDCKEHGTVTLFNPRGSWFDRSEPTLRNSKTGIESDGIKLDWTLSLPKISGDDHESYLHYYEIVRVLQDRENDRKVFRVKPVDAPGGLEQDSGKLSHHRPDWQFSDDLADLPQDMRRALLPTQNPDQAIAAATAWAKTYPGRSNVRVTYLVTPVDVAGSRALPRAFVVNVPQPSPPVRAATAKLVITLPIGAVVGPDKALERPDSVVTAELGISDPHWDPPKRDPKDVDLKTWAKPQPLGQGEMNKQRQYRLILHQDDVVPSGEYGADGLTDRPRGPGQDDTLNPVADEIGFLFKRDDLAKSQASAKLAGEDETAFPYWFHLDNLDQLKSEKEIDAGKKMSLLEVLWRRPKTDSGEKISRVAVRAFLETQTVLMQGKDDLGQPLTSRRTPVLLELRISAAKEDPSSARATNPETFEWPVGIDYPPLAPGRVRARAGMTFFKAPPAESPKAKLAALLSKTQERPVPIRDPERTVLTQIDWDAMAVAENARQTIGGYDLHELDLDDLPASRTDDQPLEKSKAWTRARRVGRVQLLRPSLAMLTPGAVEDPAGWHAHYPSETWRTLREQRRDSKIKKSLPIRRAWYSARESTLEWPSAMVRRAVLPTVNDAWVRGLFQDGNPDKLHLQLTSTNGPVTLDLDSVTIAVTGPDRFKDLRDGLSIAGGEPRQNNDLWESAADITITSANDEKPKFSPSDVRRALLSLSASAGVPSGTLTVTGEGSLPYKIEWDANTRKKNEQKTTTFRTGSVTIAIEPDGVLHPVLARALELLAYDSGTEGLVYRRYTVLTDAGTPLQAKSLEEFLSATTPEKDPYGWSALRTLGLAIGLRIYDGDKGDFLSPENLLQRVQIVFDALIAAYSTQSKPGSTHDKLGAPFVDIMLRPGKDRILGEFDAFAPPETGELKLQDDGLAFAQLALRPQPLQAFSYARLSLRWKTPPRAKIDGATNGLSLEISTPPNVSISILRRQDNRSIEAQNGKSIFELPLSALKQEENEENPWLTLLFRYRTGDWNPFPATELENDVSPGWIEIKGLDPATPPNLAARKDQIADPVTTDDVYESFPEMPSSGTEGELSWTKAFLDDQGTSLQQSLRAFVARAEKISDKFVLPPGFKQKALTTDDLKFLSRYIGWSQRFLDHTSLDLAPAGATYSLCAPIRQQPWKLAADDQGRVGLTFIHQDALAHTRAYAVRPIGRYHKFVAGTNPETRENLEELVGTATPNIGHGVAEAERTARLETPAILGTELIDEKTGADRKCWQLVVAPHPEQELIMSNRALFARLAFEGVALSFVQDYPTPWWPQRFHRCDTPQFNIPLPEYGLRPGPRAPLAQDLDVKDKFDAHALTCLSNQYPDLWKGARAYRFYDLPHHLRVTVVATARAGIVVSPMASVTQPGFHSQLPPGLQKRYAFDDKKTPQSIDIAPPQWSLKRINDKDPVYLEISFNLLSYGDLMSPKCFDTWAVPGKEITHWPDPEVIYVLVRRQIASTGKETKETIEEEDAEWQMIPEPEPQSEPEPKPGPEPKTGSEPQLEPQKEPGALLPYMLRTRGPYLKAFSGTPNYEVKFTDNPAQPIFRMKARLQWRDGALALPVSRSVTSNDDDALRFSNEIKEFGDISLQIRLQMALPGKDEDQVDRARVESLADRLEKEILPKLNGDDYAPVRAKIAEKVGQLRRLLEMADPTPDNARDARTPVVLRFPWPAGGGEIPASDDGIEINTQYVLTVRKLPDDDHLTKAKKTGLKTLFETLRQLVLGRVLQDSEKFSLRAIKGRTAPQTRDMEGPDWSRKEG